MTAPRPAASAGRRAGLTVLGALLAVTGSACSGGFRGSIEPTPKPSPTPAPVAPVVPAPVPTRVSVEKVTGQLSPQARARLRTRVGDAVDSWIDGAYGGDYPRTDFEDAFATFTDGARERALEDPLMDNARLGARVDDVRPVRRTVRLDVLGVKGVATAVTARVDLRLELTGEITRTDRVWGALYLTRVGSDAPSWRIFGYDVKRREV